MTWSGKIFYIWEELEGASSIVNFGSLIYYDNKMNCVYYGTALKLALHLRIGKLPQFLVSIRCLRTNVSPLNKENKLAEAVTLSENPATTCIMFHMKMFIRTFCSPYRTARNIKFGHKNLSNHQIKHSLIFYNEPSTSTYIINVSRVWTIFT